MDKARPVSRATGERRKRDRRRARRAYGALAVGLH